MDSRCRCGASGSAVGCRGGGAVVFVVAAAAVAAAAAAAGGGGGGGPGSGAPSWPAASRRRRRCRATTKAPLSTNRISLKNEKKRNWVIELDVGMSSMSVPWKIKIATLKKTLKGGS